jgi:hypothetical protein
MRVRGCVRAGDATRLSRGRQARARGSRLLARRTPGRRRGRDGVAGKVGGEAATGLDLEALGW